MRAAVCAIVAAIGLVAPPAFAQADRTAATFWKTVQAACDKAAAKPASELGQRIARTAINEFNSFGGHRIDANGRLFHFGLTEAEHEEDDGGNRQQAWAISAGAGDEVLGALYANDPADKLEVRGYRDASTLTQETQTADLLRTSAARSCRPPRVRPILRHAKSCARRRSARQSSIPRGRRLSSAT